MFEKLLVNEEESMIKLLKNTETSINTAISVIIKVFVLRFALNKNHGLFSSVFVKILILPNSWIYKEV